MQKQSGPAPSRRSACAAQLLPSRCVIDPSLRLSAHFCHSASLHHARQRHMADILVGMIDWFVVMTDDRSIGLSVIPPGRSPRQAVIPWDSVVRVCFEAADFLVSDDLYIFTSLRPESWLIPTEADGGRQRAHQRRSAVPAHYLHRYWTRSKRTPPPLWPVSGHLEFPAGARSAGRSAAGSRAWLR